VSTSVVVYADMRHFLDAFDYGFVFLSEEPTRDRWRSRRTDRRT